MLRERAPRFFLVLLALILAVSLAERVSAQTPVDTAAAVREARVAATAWLQIVDQGKYAESWGEAASAFQQAVTKPAWENAVRQARSPHEPFGAREEVMAQYTPELPNAPPGQYVILQYQTSVAGGRHVVETVVPAYDGERGWRVSGYFVRPT